MTTFRVWLAQDTFLYLPIYALVDLGVLARVVETMSPHANVSIDILPSPEEGDRGAIAHMLQQAETGEPSDVHLAIADPIDIFRADPKGSRSALLGAFIKRPPFWLIGRKSDPDVEVKHTYVYYNEHYATGNFLGRKLAASADNKHKIPCAMGDEFTKLHEEDVCGRYRVLTADIVGLVKTLHSDKSIEILDTTSKSEIYKDFLTTGIMTHQTYLQRRKADISMFLEAVRFSCVLLQSAEVPAAALIRQAIERGSESKPALTQVEEDQAVDIGELSRGVASRLFHDKVYSDTLHITPMEWKAAVDARTWDADGGKTQAEARALFSHVYKPHPASALTGTWLIKAFQDYGRFVTEGKRARAGAITGAIAVLALQATLLVMYGRGGAGSDLGEKILVGLSAVGGGMVMATLLALLVRSPSGIRLGIEMFLARDWGLSRNMIMGVLAFLSGTLALIVGSLVMGGEIHIYIILYYGGAALFTVIATLFILAWSKRRHA